MEAIMNFSVTLVGAGNMGGAMLRGWLENGLQPDKASVIDPSPSPAMSKFLAEKGVKHSESGADLSAGDVLMIAVKPQMMETVLPHIAHLAGQQTVVVSVAAGTTMTTLAGAFGDAAIVRVMPNTPSLVGRGMSVACANDTATTEQRSRVAALMQAVGRVEWVEDEKLIDAVTAVSGSGPAYVFHLAECMAAAGEEAGLPKELAMILARETVSGAGELMRLSEDTPETLRKNVTSPGGTTQAALEVLMEHEVMQKLFETAIAAAKKRSQELS
ncbi:MAG: pyrroline-5-carboxylate reductase [Pseudomonadota bacterium]